MSSELFTLSHSAVIELFTLDLNPIGTNVVRHYCNHVYSNGGSINFQGLTYEAIPIISSDGWEKASSGTFASPTIKISNLFGQISELILEFDGLRGAKSTRLKVLAKYLDGQPTAANVVESRDIYYISRYSENDVMVSFYLSHPLERLGLYLPRRRLISLLHS